MEGNILKTFTAGNRTYKVVEAPDGIYGYVYQIWAFPDEEEDMEPYKVYTIYRFENIDVFIENIYDSYALDNI